jgi:hypothetical protein
MHTKNLAIKEGTANNYKACTHLTHNQSLGVLQWRWPDKQPEAFVLSLTFCFFCVKAKEE